MGIEIGVSLCLLPDNVFSSRLYNITTPSLSPSLPPSLPRTIGPPPPPFPPFRSFPSLPSFSSPSGSCPRFTPTRVHKA